MTQNKEPESVEEIEYPIPSGLISERYNPFGTLGSPNPSRKIVQFQTHDDGRIFVLLNDGTVYLKHAYDGYGSWSQVDWLKELDKDMERSQRQRDRERLEQYRLRRKQQ